MALDVINRLPQLNLTLTLTPRIGLAAAPVVAGLTTPRELS